MAISLDELRHLAELARLRLSDGEILAMQSDLNRVLDHFERLQALDLSEFEAPNSADVENVWRSDEPTEGLARDDAVGGAPEVRSGLFLVPTIIE